MVSGEKPGRDSKELGEGFVPERGKWKDTKGEGYTPFLIAEIVRLRRTTRILKGFFKVLFPLIVLDINLYDHKVVLGQPFFLVVIPGSLLRSEELLLSSSFFVDCP